MIPEFPEFKKLELSDKEDIEAFTSKFPPYSDFNFVSMWCWDTKGEMRISKLNNNLVVRFTDYLTGIPFFSFLGENMVNETAEILLELSKKEGLKQELKLIPEDSIKNIDILKFNIKEDLNHNDYIIPISLLREYNTPHTKSRKKAVRSLLSKFKPEIKLLDLSSVDHQKSILRLMINQSKSDKNIIENEVLAISRLITDHKEIGILPVGLFIDSELVGFIFSGEVLKSKFTIAHFWKANIKISHHLYAYLMQEKAKILYQYGCEFLNIEQDLGIENLRKWKKSYSTEIFLKKYIITLK